MFIRVHPREPGTRASGALVETSRSSNVHEAGGVSPEDQGAQDSQGPEWCCGMRHGLHVGLKPLARSLSCRLIPRMNSESNHQGTMHVNLSSSMLISGKVPGGNPTTVIIFTSHDRLNCDSPTKLLRSMDYDYMQLGAMLMISEHRTEQLMGIVCMLKRSSNFDNQKIDPCYSYMKNWSSCSLTFSFKKRLRKSLGHDNLSYPSFTLLEKQCRRGIHLLHLLLYTRLLMFSGRDPMRYRQLAVASFESKVSRWRYPVQLSYPPSFNKIEFQCVKRHRSQDRTTRD